MHNASQFESPVFEKAFVSPPHCNEIISLVLTAEFKQQQKKANLQFLLILERNKCPQRAGHDQLCSFISRSSPLPVIPRSMADPEPSTSPKSSSTPRDCEQTRFFFFSLCHRTQTHSFPFLKKIFLGGPCFTPLFLSRRVSHFIKPHAEKVTANYTSVLRKLINATASSLLRFAPNHFSRALFSSHCTQK